ncbi:MAG: hypothetical protein IJ527_09670 [Prevotella sp.]|nr:hypothetical protein [Prevotella sp.]
MSGFFSRLFGRDNSSQDGMKQYSGPYHNGKGTFQFTETAEGERVFEGPFKYKGILGNRDVQARGQYVNNRKEGKWVYQMSSPEYKKTITADYVGGQISGIMEYERHDSAFYNGMRTVLRVTVSDGKVCGAISGNFGEAVLQGTSDEESRADGRWQMKLEDKENGNREDIEVWEHGTLKETYALDGYERSKRKTYPRLRGLVNDILDNDLRKMINIVGRGEQTPALHVNQVKV